MDFILAALLSSTSAAAASPSLCSAEEATVFTCTFTTGKLVSVCASASNPTHLQYRFGKPDKIELTFPPDPAATPSPFQAWQSAPSVGMDAYLFFTNGGYLYVLGDHFNPNNGASSGLVVVKDGKVVSSLSCKDGTKAGAAFPEDRFEVPTSKLSPL